MPTLAQRQEANNFAAENAKAQRFLAAAKAQRAQPAPEEAMPDPGEMAGDMMEEIEQGQQGQQGQEPEQAGTPALRGTPEPQREVQARTPAPQPPAPVQKAAAPPAVRDGAVNALATVTSAANWADLMTRAGKWQRQLEAIAPSEWKKDLANLKRIEAWVITALAKQPKLRQCTVASVMQAVTTAVSMGMDFTGINNEGHLVPFKSGRLSSQATQLARKNVEISECIFIPGYRGLLNKAMESPEIEMIEVNVVYQQDEFLLEYGTKPSLRHVPYMEDDVDTSKDRIRCFYAVAWMKNGRMLIPRPMTLKEVDAVRKRSRAADDGPWVTDFVAMGLKTMLKRLCKWLPKRSPALDRAMAHEEAVDAEFSVTALPDKEDGEETPAGPSGVAATGGRRAMAGKRALVAPPEPGPELAGVFEEQG